MEGKIRNIQKDIEPVAVKTKKEYPDLRGADMVNAVAEQNALQAKKNILSLSHIVKEMVEEKKLKIVAAIYDVKTGKVRWIE